jgi:hypothetical protein
MLVSVYPLWRLYSCVITLTRTCPPCLHFICILTAEGNCTRSLDAPLWVALAIVQSYNPRRKVPRSEISMSDLELCISKAAFSAAQHSGIVLVWFLNIELFSNLKHALEYRNATHLFSNACQLSKCMLFQVICTHQKILFSLNVYLIS